LSDTLRRIADLAQGGHVQISAHGYDEMAEDGILAGEVVDGVAAAVLVEDYPEYSKGPCTLVLQRDHSGSPNSRSLGHPERSDIACSAGHCLSTGPGSLD
jgi:hypothetical protein